MVPAHADNVVDQSALPALPFRMTSRFITLFLQADTLVKIVMLMLISRRSGRGR